MHLVHPFFLFHESRPSPSKCKSSPRKQATKAFLRGPAGEGGSIPAVCVVFYREYRSTLCRLSGLFFVI